MIEDICCAQDLKALTDVLEATPFAFALELAALAARREYLNLEKWLQERLTAHGVPFVQVSFFCVSAAPSSDDQARRDCNDLFCWQRIDDFLGYFIVARSEEYDLLRRRTFLLGPLILLNHGLP